MLSLGFQDQDTKCVSRVSFQVSVSSHTDLIAPERAPRLVTRNRSVLGALPGFRRRGCRVFPRHAACSRLAGTRRSRLAASTDRPGLLIHLGPELRGRLPELVSLGHGHRYSPVYELRNSPVAARKRVPINCGEADPAPVSPGSPGTALLCVPAPASSRGRGRSPWRLPHPPGSHRPGRSRR